MKITTKDIDDSKQNRDKFNKYYNEAVIDVLALKNDCNMTIKEIQDATPYEIDFIIHVFENYDINEYNNNNDKEYNISLKINKDNIDVKKLKDLGYNDALIQDMLNSEEEGTSYYQPK